MNIKKEYKDKIIALICTMMPNVDIYLFNTATKNSSTNISIALKGKEKTNTSDLREVENILAAANIPHKINLIDYHSSDEKTKKEIDQYATLWKRAINIVTREKIEEVKNRLIKTYNPLEIYLFGSYVWGNPTKASDLDLLIVVEKSDEKSYKRSIRGSEALIDIDVSTDLLVYTRNEFEKLASEVTTLCHKIKKEGETIYAISWREAPPKNLTKNLKLSSIQAGYKIILKSQIHNRTRI